MLFHLQGVGDCGILCESVVAHTAGQQVNGGNGLGGQVFVVSLPARNVRLGSRLCVRRVRPAAEKSFYRRRKMIRKHKRSMLWLAAVLVGCVVVTAIEGEGKTVVKIVKHRIPGTVCDEQFEASFEKAKETWEKAGVEVRQVGGIQDVNDVNEGRVAGAVNVYGTGLKTNPPARPGRCFNQNYIEIGKPADSNDASTLAHELGHWFDAIPDSTTGEHGNEIPNGYPGDPNYNGYDTDGDGDCDGDDANNIMFPGTGRTGTDIDPNQVQRFKDNADKFVRAEDAKAGGAGATTPSDANDAPPSSDIDRCSAWGLQEGDHYMVYFRMLLSGAMDWAVPGEFGFYIESDQDVETGEFYTGMDYYVGFNADMGGVVFREAVGEFGWVDLPPDEIEMEIEVMSEALTEAAVLDAPSADIAIGFTLSMPETVFVRRGPDDVVSWYAVSLPGPPPAPPFDRAPNSGVRTMLTKPVYVERVTGDLDGDDRVDLDDFQIMVSHWLDYEP